MEQQGIHLAPLIHDLAIILGVAAIVAFIFRRIRQPVVLGYIIAGVIVGPYTPGILHVSDMPNVRIWAELGVIFLMFALGLEFSFRKLARVGISGAITALIQVTLMLLIGYSFARTVGWSTMESVYLGCMISISSTTIIIKAFEELRLKTKHFAQMVFAILIVEDLAAILMLVGLSSIAVQSSLGGFDLLVAAAKLVLVVGTWFLVGMFVIPRFVKSFRKHGDNELITVLSIGLCLGLVTLASYFHYSAALGAFIMGSILAETSEAKRIEGLIHPLKDVFGAIFFVSVGMLMDPQILVDHFWFILAISLLIIIGQVFSLTFGSLVTGNSLSNAIRISFSMAQIGEFSFIIATVGLSYGVISQNLYPMIVATSLITTFTTPYLMKIAPKVGDYLEKNSPKSFKSLLKNYNKILQKAQGELGNQKIFYQLLFRWAANAAIVIIIFLLSGRHIIPWLLKHDASQQLARGLGWLIAISFSAPFLWGMTQVFKLFSAKDASDRRGVEMAKRAGLYLSHILSVLLIGVLSLEFFPPWIAFLLTIIVGVLIFFTLKKQLRNFYQWLESQFQSGFHAQNAERESAEVLSHLAPWDTHLASIAVHPNSPIIAKPLAELRLREIHGVNIVAIQRGKKIMIAPKATDFILPEDQLLFLGTDDEIDKIRNILEVPPVEDEEHSELSHYKLRRVLVQGNSPLVGLTIMQSGIREKFGGMVVGVERNAKRIFNPKSDFIILADDLLWIVGLGSQADLPAFLKE